MATVKKSPVKKIPNPKNPRNSGRHKLPAAEKAQSMAAYLNLEERVYIIKNFGSLTKAVRDKVLPKLTPAEV